LYEGFTHKNPLKGKKFQELLRDISRPEIPPLTANRPDLPEQLSDTLDRAMFKDHNTRPDAATFGRLLSEAARDMPYEVPGEPLATRVMRRITPRSMSRDRAAYLGQHFAAGVSSLLTLLFVLPRVPFYPLGWLVPLIAVPAFLSLVWPFAGAILALLLLAPPIFAFSAGWGVIYAVLAVVSLFLLRRRGLEWGVLLPGVMPFAALGGVGLAVMPLAGALLRRWGLLVGFLCGLALAVTVGFAGWATLPYTFNPGPGATLAATSGDMSPWAALLGFARFLDSRPELTLQICLFALFSLPLYALGSRFRSGRVWGGSVYLVALFAAFVLLPVAGLGVPVNVGRFVVSYAPCAIIAYLCTLLISSAGQRSL
jgi:hypothetical protein